MHPQRILIRDFESSDPSIFDNHYHTVYAQPPGSIGMDGAYLGGFAGSGHGGGQCILVPYQYSYQAHDLNPYPADYVANVVGGEIWFKLQNPDWVTFGVLNSGRAGVGWNQGANYAYATFFWRSGGYPVEALTLSALAEWMDANGEYHSLEYAISLADPYATWCKVSMLPSGEWEVVTDDSSVLAHGTLPAAPSNIAPATADGFSIDAVVNYGIGPYPSAGVYVDDVAVYWQPTIEGSLDGRRQCFAPAKRR